MSQIEAGRRFPSAEALDYFASRLGVSADELSSPVPPSLRVDLELAVAEGRGAFDAGDPLAAAQAYERLRSKASSGGSGEYEAEALLGLGEVDERAGRITEAIDRYHAAEGLAETDELRLRLRLALGRAFRSGGDIAYSIDVLEQVLAQALEERWLVDAVKASVLLASSLTERGDHHRAWQVLESVSEAAEMLDDPRALAAWHWIRGRNVAALGRPADALKHLALARGLYERQRATVELARLDSARAYTLMEIDRHAEAAALYETAVSKLFDAGAVQDATRMQTELARAHLAVGRRSEARRIAEDALARLREMEDPIEEATCAVVLALALGSEPRAEELLRSAVDILEARGAAELLARALQALGEFYVLTGRQAEAIEAFRRALAGVVTPVIG